MSNDVKQDAGEQAVFQSDFKVLKESHICEALHFFSQSLEWKKYFKRFLYPYLGDEVLEVGAGLGSTTHVLCSGKEKRWVCLEPDIAFVKLLEEKIGQGYIPRSCEVVHGHLPLEKPIGQFDSALYIDVLEHIYEDEKEIERAAEMLRPGGKLIILVPAYSWLYTPFDHSVGHYRRYRRRTLRRLVETRFRKIFCHYLDFLGMMASAANKYLLRKKLPTQKDVLFWDRFMIPISRCIDPLLLYSTGRSIVGVWEKR
ncbi:MAG: methyltransferase [Candidatus Omnitrophota bacterium]